MREGDVIEMGEQEKLYWWHVCRRLIWRTILDKWLPESYRRPRLSAMSSRPNGEDGDPEMKIKNFCYGLDSRLRGNDAEGSGGNDDGSGGNDDGERPPQNDDLTCHPGPTGQGPSSDSESRPGFRIESGMTKEREIATVRQVGPRNDASTKGMQIVDVGCGGGFNLEFLKRWGNVTGIDKSEASLASAKQYGTVEMGDAINLPRADASVDLITAFDVLEHLLDEATALKEWYRVLKFNGYIAISVPAYQWLFGPHDKALLHHRRYTLGELSNKLSQAGFKPIFSSYIFMFTFPVFLIQRLLAKSAKQDVGYNSAPSIINQLLINFGKLEAWLVRYISLPFGSSVFILAKKYD